MGLGISDVVLDGSEVGLGSSNAVLNSCGSFIICVCVSPEFGQFYWVVKGGEVISNLIKTLRIKTNKELIVLVSPSKVNRTFNEALLRREADFTLSSSARTSDRKPDRN